MAEDLQQRAVRGALLEAENAEHDEAHVAERRIGDHRLPRGLAQCQHGAVQDARHRQQRHQRRPLHGGVGRQRQRQLDQAERAHLRHQPGHQRCTGGRGGAIGRRQPRMEWHQRALDRAGQHHREEHEGLLPRRQVHGGQRVEAESPAAVLVQVGGAQQQHGGQQQHAAGHRVQEEGQRCLTPLRAAENQDKQQHRDQHRFPEHEEHDQVLREEGAEQAGLQRQQQREIQPRLRLFGGPAAAQHHREQQRGQQQQVQVEAVDTEVQRDAERVDQRPLQRRPGAAVEADEDRERERQLGQHQRQRQPARRAQAEQGDCSRAGQRQQQDDRQQR